MTSGPARLALIATLLLLADHARADPADVIGTADRVVVEVVSRELADLRGLRRELPGMRVLVRGQFQSVRPVPQIVRIWGFEDQSPQVEDTHVLYVSIPAGALPRLHELTAGYQVRTRTEVPFVATATIDGKPRTIAVSVPVAEFDLSVDFGLRRSPAEIYAAYGGGAATSKSIAVNRVELRIDDQRIPSFVIERERRASSTRAHRAQFKPSIAHRVRRALRRVLRGRVRAR